MTQLLSLNKVSFAEGKTNILDNVSLDLCLGEVTGLLGVNGAGKSTIIQIAAGIILPSKGRVDKSQNIILGYVPDIPPLQLSLSVLDYLFKKLKLASNIVSQSQKELLFFVVEALDLSFVINDKIKTIYKGNQQRVAIAQALLPLPNVLLLDEPTIALDPLQLEAFRNLIRQIKPKMSVLFSTHLIQEVNELCDNIVLVNNGKITHKLSVDTSRKDCFIEIEGENLDWIEQESAFISKEFDYYQFRFLNQNDLDVFITNCIQRKISIKAIEKHDTMLKKQLLLELNK